MLDKFENRDYCYWAPLGGKTVLSWEDCCISSTDLTGVAPPGSPGDHFYLHQMFVIPPPPSQQDNNPSRKLNAAIWVPLIASGQKWFRSLNLQMGHNNNVSFLTHNWMTNSRLQSAGQRSQQVRNRTQSWPEHQETSCDYCDTVIANF